MLSITGSTSFTEESNVAATVPVQDRPENIADNLVDNTRAESPVEDHGARHDIAAPATANQEADPVVAASSAHHPAIGTRYEKLRSGDLDPMFEVGSAVKVLSLAEALWRDLDGSYSTLSSALSAYRGAADGGLSTADLIALRSWLNDARG